MQTNQVAANLSLPFESLIEMMRSTEKFWEVAFCNASQNFSVSLKASIGCITLLATPLTS